MSRPAPTDTAALARGLARAAAKGVLAVGGPYAGLVLVASAPDASPLLLISELAEHTKALRRDPACALAIDGTEGLADPLTGPRITIVGTAAPDDDVGLRDRFLRRHASAQRYAGFADFHLWRVQVERVHLVGGFGRIHWLAAQDFRIAPGLAGLEADILGHMNEDHADALDLYAARLLKRRGKGWRAVGIDPEGLDMAREGKLARLPFETPVTDAKSARLALAALARRARGE